MSQTSKIILIAVAAALIGGGVTYLWQANQSPKFAGVVKYNCEKSGGSFTNNNCVCPIETEIGQTQEIMYDKNTGYCQTTYGGPGGDALAASIGKPYGGYGFYLDIIASDCKKSGGDWSTGAVCVCSKNMTYDKATGYCK